MSDLIIVILLSAFTIVILAGFIYFRSRQIIQLQAKLSNIESLLAKKNIDEVAHDKELTELKEKIVATTVKDAVTGLPNRNIFEDRLQQELNQSGRHQLIFAIMFLNLDGFKVINNTLGLKAGDEVLKEAADRMQASIRKMDTVSHFAGDEFVFILSQLAKPESAVYVVQRVLTAIAQPFRIRDQEVYVTASIGIAIYPMDGDTVELLLKNADNALHRAKAEGRNHYQFYRKEMFTSSRRELTLSSNLRNPNVYQDFLIYYQPQVNIETQQIISLEAILHWQHADFGLLQQNDFYQLAENSGSIFIVGEWLLDHACRQFKQWTAYPLHPQSLAIKVSLKQLDNPHFTYKISQILRQQQIDPGQLILEITESMLTKGGMVEKSFYMLKQLGIQIGICEFGMGKIALQDLQNFPVDYLKIAASLVKEIGVNKEMEAIVKMVIGLGNTLGLRVIAEGVEKDAQKKVLADMGCLLMQGQLFGAPILATELTQLLKESQTRPIV